MKFLYTRVTITYIIYIRYAVTINVGRHKKKKQQKNEASEYGDKYDKE